ncbi:MAG: hypothetical protein ACLRWP_07950 [Bilophila wadsworthia]
MPLVQHAASRGAGGVEACRRAASLGWFLAHPILGTEPEDSGLYGAASRSGHDGELFAALHKVFPCADHVRRAAPR